MQVSRIKKKEIIRAIFGGGGTAVLVDFILYNLLVYMGMDRNIAIVVNQ